MGAGIAGGALCRADHEWLFTIHHQNIGHRASLKQGDSPTLPHRRSLRHLAEPPGHNSLGMFADETTKARDFWAGMSIDL